MLTWSAFLLILFIVYHDSVLDNPEYEYKQMDFDSGTKFLKSTWEFVGKIPIDYIDIIVERNITIGLYLKSDSEIIVSGVVLGINGFISMLYTDKKYRGKGFGKSVLQVIAQKLIENELFPCSAISSDNIASINLHRSSGMEMSHRVPFINYGGM